MRDLAADVARDGDRCAALACFVELGFGFAALAFATAGFGFAFGAVAFAFAFVFALVAGRFVGFAPGRLDVGFCFVTAG
ncbi:MAG: hypothetical protein M3680_34265 [Myxococcota bacterium]|nr:hypothetical protein [Myxococcota bacterium]